MPTVACLLDYSLKLFEIDKGIAGGTPADPIPYLAIGYLYFDRLLVYQNSFRPNAEKSDQHIAIRRHINLIHDNMICY